jgi:hypothetical protein
MRRGVSGLAACCLLLGMLVAPALGRASLRRCGQVPRTVTGYYVDVDPVTTTCGLGRSPARSYVRRHHRRVIYGRSPKTGLTYRFHRVRRGFHGFRSFSTYVGHAGRARLKVRFTYPFY